MQFRVLGPLEVRRDGRTLEVRGSKRRTVLAILVLHANEVVRTARLIEELWGENPPANAASALHNHVSRLRKDLGGDALATKPWGYVLRTDPEAIDLRRFERLVAEARALPANERAEKLLEALALWRGAPLADLASEPALQVEIARLEEQRLSALEQRIDADLELGGHEELVPELEALVAVHPLRERLRGQLILALYRSGRQAEALETYRETRRVLVDELGIEPTPELRELERAILRQDPALASKPSPPDPVDAEPPPSRWRWPRSPLVAAALLLLAVGGAAAAIIGMSGDDPGGEAGVTPVAAASRTPSSTPDAERALHTSVSSRRTSTSSVRTTAKSSKPPAVTSRPRARESRESAQQEQRRSPTTRLKPSSASKSKPKATPPPPPPPRPPPSRPAPPPPPPPPPPPAVPPAWYWIADDFSVVGTDFARWHIASDGTGVQLAEQNGALAFSVGGDPVTDGTYGADEHYGTNCRLTRDFDARIDFRLVTWPVATGVQISFAVYVPPPNHFYSSISRVGGTAAGGREGYQAGGAGNAWVQTADTAGALRLRRTDGVLTSYYRSRERWVRLASGPARGAAHLLIGVYTNTDRFGGQPAHVTIDNFDATAESVDCPGVPLPPRKPRG